MSARTLRARLRRSLARTLAATARTRPGLRVLTYHRVNDEHPRDRLSVPVRAFAAQMEALAAAGRPVLPLAAVLPALRGEAELQARAVAITFDDGYADNAIHAAPVLARFGFPATFFVVTGRIGGRGTIERYLGCCDADRMMSWDELRSLRAAGHALGGHGREHRELAGLPPQEAHAEIAGCRQDLEGQLGERPRLFCYPRGSFDPSARRIVAEEGFLAACTVVPGANRVGAELLALRRTEVSADDEIADFLLKLDGGFDAWHTLVQRARRRRAA
jgi:peptidoglycan/xylan/chitin deacetylase (PgdA/CDA1 family)